MAAHYFVPSDSWYHSKAYSDGGMMIHQLDEAARRVYGLPDMMDRRGQECERGGGLPWPWPRLTYPSFIDFVMALRNSSLNQH